MQIQVNTPIGAFNFIGKNFFLGRTGFNLAVTDIELRPVPRALYRAAHHHASGERASAVRAMIVECHISGFLRPTTMRFPETWINIIWSRFRSAAFTLTFPLSATRVSSLHFP